MARTSTALLNEQNQILSNIDAFLTCIEKFPDNGCATQSISVNPLDFLLKLMFRIKKQDKLYDFLANFLKKEIPMLEATIKGILLANLKKMTDCSLDPRIPDYMRTSGITLDLGLIDVYQSLNESPLDTRHNQLYMSCDTDLADSPYSFIRGYDFNTFLWYVIHKGKYPTPSRIDNFDNNNGDLHQHFQEQVSTSVTTPYTIFKHLPLTGNTIINGQSFTQKEEVSGYLLRGISVATTKNGHTELFPVGESQVRTTYYVNRDHYFDFIKYPNKSPYLIERDYNADIPLCSLSYSGSVDSNSYTYYSKKINLTVLEKPFIHLMNGAQRILFDAEGNPNQNGHYTVKRLNETTLCKYKNGFFYYEIEKPKNIGEGETHFYLLLKNYDYKIATTLDIDFDTFQGISALPFLHECYPHLTVYEFNYDFVMSMRLFDSKVLISQLINTMCHTTLGNVTLSLSTNYHVLSEQINSIIKNMLESDDSESSDCFFSFSNAEIEDKLHKADLKRANLVPFGDSTTDVSARYDELRDLIDAFGAETTIEGSTEILKRMVTVIDATISNEHVDDTDDYSLKYGMLNTFFHNLVAILVNSILSPKVLMIFLINYEMYGGSTGKNSYNPEDLLQAMINPIRSIVKELRDLLIRELYNYLIVFLRELCVIIQQKVLLEQVNNYRKIVKLMLDECLFSFGQGQRLNTTIDNVDYADIDNTEITQTEPKC